MDQADNGRPLTLGERRVRISFNPNQAPHVGELKRQAAAFIDYCEALSERAREFVGEDRRELYRLLDLAQTDMETAAMHAVKAATIGLP